MLKTNRILTRNAPNFPVTGLVSHHINWESLWYIFGSAFRSVSKIRCSWSLSLSRLHVAPLGCLPLLFFPLAHERGLVVTHAGDAPSFTRALFSLYGLLSATCTRRSFAWSQVQQFRRVECMKKGVLWNGFFWARNDRLLPLLGKKRLVTKLPIH